MREREDGEKKVLASVDVCENKCEKNNNETLKWRRKGVKSRSTSFDDLFFP